MPLPHARQYSFGAGAHARFHAGWKAHGQAPQGMRARHHGFAEAAVARSARLELYIPFEEATFLAKSVDFAGGDWRARFFGAKARATLHVLPLERGETPKGEDPYERNNRWMLDAAARFGSEVDFVCLWNGEGGDGPGGTRDMMEEVQNRGGQALWLNTTKLWG